MLFRFDIALVLSIVFLTSSACTTINSAANPAVDASENDHAEEKATAEEIHHLAEKGSASAQNELGLLYMAGAGVSQNYGQAKQWFEKAAKQGHAEAQVNLGVLYLRGDGAPQSAQMALFWFNRAAEQGDPPAFAKLGRMYEKGHGVPKDVIQAHMWFNLAASTGDEYSAERRDTLATQMTPSQIAEAKQRAQEWKPTKKSVAWKFRIQSDALLEARENNTTAPSLP
ncbi:tetratricopeptide repeat protein [Petrachloros mirabilis]